MTVPPNPGGQNRRLVRTVLAQWLTAQRIQGLDKVYRSEPPEAALELYRTGDLKYSCQAWIVIPTDSEDRLSIVGPVSPSGKKIHYPVQLVLWHRSYEPGELDWANDEDDYDRIYDAVKDALRGAGRRLGRPEAIFSVGEVDGLKGRHERPAAAGDSVDREGTLQFTVTQVI